MMQKLVLAGAIALLWVGAVGAELISTKGAIAQVVDGKKQEIDLVLQQCRQDLQNNQNEAATKSCNQALMAFRQLKNREGEARALNNLGVAYDALSAYSKAIANLNQSLAIAREIKDRLGEGRALNNLGNAYDSLGNYPKAIEYHDQRLAIAREIKDRLGEEQSLGNLGNVYKSLGNYPKAIEYQEQSLAIAREINDRRGEGQSLGNLGSAYRLLGNYPKAIEYQEQHLAIAREIKDRLEEGNALGNLGNAYEALGNYPKAIEYHQQSLAIAREINDRRGEGQTLGNLGLAYDSLGNYPKAIEYYEQYLAIAREINDRRGEGQSLGNLGLAYDSLGNYPKAIEYQEQSLAIKREIKDRRGAGNALGNLGLAYQSLGNYPRAIEYHEQSLAIAREIRNRDGERIGLNNIAVVHNSQKQIDLAILFYKQSVNVTESIRQDNRKLERALQTSYTEKVTFTYRNLADLLLSQGRIGEAQQVLELLKIQEINDITKGTRSNTSLVQVPLSTVEKEIVEKYNSLIAFGEKLTQCEQTRCPDLDRYREQRRQLTTAYNSFIQTITAEKDAQRRVAIDEGTKTFIARSERIVTAQPNSVLIYPLVLKDKTRILWAAKGGVLSQAECPLGEAQLTKRIGQFRTALQTSDDLTPVQTTGKALYQCLFPEKLQTELTKNKIENLIFVPDRATNYIPMAALYDGQQYLIQRFAVSNILATQFTDTKDKLPPQAKVLGLGLSQAVTLTNPNRTFAELPYVPTELQGILPATRTSASRTSASRFSGSTWLDRDFTRKRLEDGLLTQSPNILHFATHGEFVPAEPSQSYLVLGDSTPFEISQIQYLTNLSNVHLVVLSACETALGGSDRNGLEIAGIASYFLGDESKAKAVLASLWKVNDPATSLLMTQFYAQLSQGKLSKSHALRQVQLDLLNSPLTLKDAAARAGARPYNPDKKRPKNLSHPYYWAPFILIGNSQ
jgi:CHAT domain-containing protein